MLGGQTPCRISAQSRVMAATADSTGTESGLLGLLVGSVVVLDIFQLRICTYNTYIHTSLTSNIKQLATRRKV